MTIIVRLDVMLAWRKMTSQALAAMIGILEPNLREPDCETTEHHVLHHEDECVFVLEGHATAIIGEAEHPIEPSVSL